MPISQPPATSWSATERWWRSWISGTQVAGRGTRATELTTLIWYTFQNPWLDGVRRRLWTRVFDLVGSEGAAVLAAAHILHMLEIPIRHGRHDVAPGMVERGHRTLDELNALR